MIYGLSSFPYPQRSLRSHFQIRFAHRFDLFRIEPTHPLLATFAQLIRRGHSTFQPLIQPSLSRDIASSRFYQGHTRFRPYPGPCREPHFVCSYSCFELSLRPHLSSVFSTTTVKMSWLSIAWLAVGANLALFVDAQASGWVPGQVNATMCQWQAPRGKYITSITSPFYDLR